MIKQYENKKYDGRYSQESNGSRVCANFNVTDEYFHFLGDVKKRISGSCSEFS